MDTQMIWVAVLALFLCPEYLSGFFSFFPLKRQDTHKSGVSGEGGVPCLCCGFCVGLPSFLGKEKQEM